MKVERIEYGGWKNCLRLSNGTAEIVITLDVGPRLIRWALEGGPNQFKEFEKTMGRTGDAQWNIYGGHRLWHAPEEQPRTYVVDNSPVEFEDHSDEGFVTLRPPLEETTRLQKEYDVYLLEGARARIVHRTINHNVWGAEFAMWSLSVMDAGGVCVFPLPPRGTHPEMLAPTSTLTLWAFTDLTDPRWLFTSKYIGLRQNASGTSPQKIGAWVPDGWAAYANHNQLFVKRFAAHEGPFYADLNCNFETFTNETMLEVEALGPLQVIEPGEGVEHVEEWAIFDNVALPTSEADIDANILPLVQQVPAVEDEDDHSHCDHD
jgi:hypothetical protein